MSGQDVQGCNDAIGSGRGGWQHVHEQLLLCLLVQRVLILCLFGQPESNCRHVLFCVRWQRVQMGDGGMLKI